MAYDDRITKKRPRGQHIPLQCKNHPNAKYHTKNIDFIGARTIFRNGDEDCNCPTGDLVVAPEVLQGPDVPE